MIFNFPVLVLRNSCTDMYLFLPISQLIKVMHCHNTCAGAEPGGRRPVPGLLSVWLGRGRPVVMCGPGDRPLHQHVAGLGQAGGGHHHLLPTGILVAYCCLASKHYNRLRPGVSGFISPCSASSSSMAAFSSSRSAVSTAPAGPHYRYSLCWSVLHYTSRQARRARRQSSRGGQADPLQAQGQAQDLRDQAVGSYRSLLS